VLGLCSYYRKFVKNFSKVAKPLTELTRKETKFEWDERRQGAFDELKKRLIEYSQPDFSKEFILITDALGIGLGAVLSQLDEKGREYVIAYASKSLNKTEQNYPIMNRNVMQYFGGFNIFTNI
jgi:hypothetical protein